MSKNDTRCPGGNHRPMWHTVCRLCGAEDDEPITLGHIILAGLILIGFGMVLGSALMIR